MSTNEVGRVLRPWEEDERFSDLLYEWMNRAPWLAISAAAHLLVILILLAIPWDLLQNRAGEGFITKLDEFPDEVFEDPPPEEPQEIEEQPTEEPVLQDAELSDHDETEDEQDYASAEGDPDMLADSPLDAKALSDVLGIGGSPGGKFGDRFGGREKARRRGGSGTEQSVTDGLAWLSAHQSPDGSWDSDGFMTNCGKIGSTICGGVGEAPHDVGMTGLALLAFLGDGHTTREAQYKDVVARGVKWLKDQQDPDMGLLGPQIGQSYLYNHAIGTLAICEAYYFSKSPLIKRTAQDAINFITRARNPYSAWRYEYPPTGESDTSVTGWMVFALKSAEESGLEIDPQAYVGALSWIDEVTDPATGRVGYTELGTVSSRVPGVNSHFPPEKGEAMTAVGLLCRFFMGQDPKDVPMMEKHAQLMKTKLPKWDPDGFGCDMYYWYYGSYAMYQMGGAQYWEAWNKAMKPAVVDSQRREGDEKGSWDPVGPWGYAGGRVYSTALMVLCLEVYYRYAKVLGAR